MTREEKQKAIDALKISAPLIAVTHEEFNDYIQTLNKIMDWLEQEPNYSEIPTGSMDYISKQEVVGLMMHIWGKNFSGDDAMQECIDAIRVMPSVTPQEPQSFKWCTDCKEYDQEKHCCHRYSKVIRDAVAEIKQEPKTGHWIGIDEEPHEDYECDKCGYTISTYTANIEPHTEYKYCPNCGAKMESGG